MLRLVGFAAVLVLAGCERTPYPEMVTTEVDQPTFAPEPPSRPPRPIPTAANNGRDVLIDEGNFRWSYSYPAAVGAIPELRQEYDNYLEETLSADRNMTRSVWADQRNNGRRMTPLFYRYTRAVVADLPGWLSLSARSWSGNGAALNDPYFGGGLWDKAARQERQPIDLFVSKEQLACAIVAPVLARMERQRARKPLLEWREQHLRAASIPDPCEIPASYALILGSTNGQKFDRIGVMIQPLSGGTEAHPRAEHAIELTLPVNAAILEAVKPEYRSAFALAR